MCAQVNIPKRQLLLSEQAALQKELAAHLKEGDIVEGVVHNTAPFGAFVKIKGPDGQMRGLSVRLPSRSGRCRCVACMHQ
jgi:ribosomal protein S1